MKRTVIVLGLSACLAAHGVAGEIDNLVNKLAEKGIITYGEAAELIAETEEDTKMKLSLGQSPSAPAWTQKITLKGDVRVRYQTDWTGSGDPRIRERIRVRVGLDTAITDSIKAGFGLATGAGRTSGVAVTNAAVSSTGSHTHTATVTQGNVVDGEPRSTNFTLGDSLSKGLIWLDYAFVEYSPMGWATLTLGKFKNTAWQTSDILWDTDLYHDGAALCFKYNINPDLNVFLNNEFVVIDEVSATNMDPTMALFQPGVSAKFMEGLFSAKAAVAYWSFNTVKGVALDHSAGTNAQDSSKRNLVDFDVVNPSVELGMSDIFGYDGKLALDYALNSSTDVRNVGYCLSATFGNAKIAALGNWQVKYMLRYLEQNAFPDCFPDSDFYSGGTSRQGHELIFTVGLGKNTQLGLDYYIAERLKINPTDLPQERSLIQVDVVHKF